jgi:hypothetical protein
MGTVNWREVVQDRETRRRIIVEVLTLLGEWRRRKRGQSSVDNSDLCPLYTYSHEKYLGQQCINLL